MEQLIMAIMKDGKYWYGLGYRTGKGNLRNHGPHAEAANQSGFEDRYQRGFEAGILIRPAKKICRAPKCVKCGSLDIKVCEPDMCGPCYIKECSDD